MTTIRLILHYHLSDCITSLRDYQPNDTVLFCEVLETFTNVKHHPKKIAFILAANRHFAAMLKEKGLNIYYIKLDDPTNTQSITEELKRVAKILQATRVIITAPDSYQANQMVKSWSNVLGIHVEIRQDDRFLCSIQEFNLWAYDRKQLRMEYFYREMRKKYNILLEKDNKPTGGQWNYDKENRKPPVDSFKSPQRISHKQSKILQDVLQLVEAKFHDHFGELEPFHYAVTREQALIELDDFIERILPFFGDYQDAMLKGKAYLNHSLLSSYINIGLLLPLEVCKKAEDAYRKNKAPLNSVEGFIRQILGWREYVRGIYWLKMPEYAELNYLSTNIPLPAFYWGAQTGMQCIAEAIIHTKKYSYSHHIQRLMVTGNFALLAGIDVKQVQDWYLAVYSDAYEWVEMPNTLGMALFGDGGIMASKPYAASGKYINKMSNFCRHCRYDPEEMVGENACPFNALYWDFLIRNRIKLEGNQRLPYVFSTWDKFDNQKQISIRAKAAKTLDLMQKGLL
jgi:deoxyribodipyrimidine photolyase-related protein